MYCLDSIILEYKKIQHKIVKMVHMLIYQALYDDCDFKTRWYNQRLGCLHDGHMTRAIYAMEGQKKSFGKLVLKGS